MKIGFSWHVLSVADIAAGSGELGISDLQKSGAHVNLCLQAPEVQCREPCQSVAENPKKMGMETSVFGLERQESCGGGG